MDLYDGVVVFRDGVHYAVDQDGDPDLDRPLRWVEHTTYRDAVEGESLHNDGFHVSETALEVGGES